MVIISRLFFISLVYGAASPVLLTGIKPQDEIQIEKEEKRLASMDIEKSMNID